VYESDSEEAKTIILLAIVVLGTIGGYGIFMVAMGTTSPLVVVTSGSMEPTLYAGDLCVIQARAEDQILLSDIIVYWDTTYHSDGPIIHRVVDIQIIDGEYFYYTKGDNNQPPSQSWDMSASFSELRQDGLQSLSYLYSSSSFLSLCAKMGMIRNLRMLMVQSKMRNLR
jgi:signal peptidase